MKARSLRGARLVSWASATVSIGTLGSAGTARADTPMWDPGHRTTDRLQGEAKAQEGRSSNDGVYDRLDGDVTFTLGLGAEVGNGTRGALVARALYYHSGGLVVGYADELFADSALERVVFVGGEVRPLFMPRWALDLEGRQPLLDLTLDSLSLGAGAYFGETEGESIGERPGFEATVGFGVPLFASAKGPWLEFRGTYRGGLRERPLGALFLLSIYETWVSPLIR
jgi:hypothetical protein